MANRDTDAELAIAAARAGAEVVRARFGTAMRRYGKAADDFATAADLDAERAIRDVIGTARPHDAITGEEHGTTGENTRHWLVDPLCGTLNYSVRTTLAAVNVALRDGSAAATADPFTNEVFWTDGDRAWVRQDNMDQPVDQPLVPTADSRLVDLNLDPPFPNAPAFLAAKLLTQQGFRGFRPRVVSTTLAVAWVAAGRRAAYVTDGRLRDSVHFASGIALCVAAGCVVTGLHGQPVHTGAEGLVVAADRDTHDTLLALISDQALAEGVGHGV